MDMVMHLKSRQVDAKYFYTRYRAGNQDMNWDFARREGDILFIGIDLVITSLYVVHMHAIHIRAKCTT